MSKYLRRTSLPLEARGNTGDPFRLGSSCCHSLPALGTVSVSKPFCTWMQVQSNALAALEAIDKEMADKILAQGCITGDRINGLVDGETGKW